MVHWENGLAALTTELDGLSMLREGFSRDLATPFDAAVSLVLDVKGRTIVSGMGKSGHIARKFAATLSSTGTPALFIHPAEAGHGDLGAITDRDAVFLISNSGESAELSAILNYARRFGVPTIAITSSPTSTLARYSDIVLKTPNAQEACPNGLAPTTSTLVQLALCDALAVALLKARNFRPVDFHTYHPSGKLGASIRTVSSLMRPRHELPLVGPDMLMREALVEMTGKAMGILGVIDDAGALSGVITDGDLRRHLADPGILSKRTSEVMTRVPRTIEENQLLADAVREFEKHKITALFVVDGHGHLRGLLRLNDMIQIGLL